MGHPFIMRAAAEPAFARSAVLSDLGARTQGSRYLFTGPRGLWIQPPEDFAGQMEVVSTTVGLDETN
jgi:hypothetical protein